MSFQYDFPNDRGNVTVDSTPDGQVELQINDACEGCNLTIGGDAADEIAVALIQATPTGLVPTDIIGAKFRQDLLALSADMRRHLGLALIRSAK